MSENEESHHPYISRLAEEVNEYLLRDLSVMYNELELRRVEETLREIEEHSMGYYGVLGRDPDYDRFQEIHDDIGRPLEALSSQLGDIYVRVTATYERTRDHVSGRSAEERLRELEERGE